MPKKRVTKEISEVKIIEHGESSGLQGKILENLVELQKIHTNLAEKFDKLATEISNLMALFEVAARSFAESPSVMATEKDKAFLEKIDKLIEQNKTIAKGLVLMEDRVRERIYTPSKQSESSPAPTPTPEKEDFSDLQPSLNTKPLPRF